MRVFWHPDKNPWDVCATRRPPLRAGPLDSRRYPRAETEDRHRSVWVCRADPRLFSPSEGRSPLSPQVAGFKRVFAATVFFGTDQTFFRLHAGRRLTAKSIQRRLICALLPALMEYAAEVADPTWFIRRWQLYASIPGGIRTTLRRRWKRRSPYSDPRLFSRIQFGASASYFASASPATTENFIEYLVPALGASVF